MTDESKERPVVIELNGLPYVLAPMEVVKVGDEFHEIFMYRQAIEPTPEETALPSDAQSPFSFYWDRPGDGNVIVLSQVGGYLKPSGSTRVGYTREFKPIVIDPVPPEHREGPWLAVGYTPSHMYTPLSIPGLHRRFARLDDNSEKALGRFACRFGLLGHGAYALSFGEGEPEVNGRIESIGYWRNEIAAMQRLVKIWDLIKRKEAGKLGKWVKWRTVVHPVEGWTRQTVFWDDEKIEESENEAGILIIARSGERMELATEGHPEMASLTNWKVGDILGPAYLYLCMKINERLRGHVTSSLTPFVRGDIISWPDCLLSAMYVLFAFEVSGKSRPAIQCRGCLKYFVPAHGSQRYCESKCSKSKWWRENR